MAADELDTILARDSVDLMLESILELRVSYEDEPGRLTTISPT